MACAYSSTLIFVSTLFGIATTQAAAPSRPNVVLFLVDDMGWVDCGAYGSKYYETPNIDAFAKRAMRFTNAYSQPLCSPTRASLLTGLYSARHGITSPSGHLPPQPPGHVFLAEKAAANVPMLLPQSKNYLEPSYYTLAEALHDAGYRTGHFGKWHLGTTPPHWPEAQGFDTAFHCHPDPGPPGEYFSPYNVIREGKPSGKQRVGTITDGPPGEYIVDRLAAEAEQFIAANREQPFYLNLWNYGVHGPWGHKQDYTAKFQGKVDPRGEQGNPIMASMLRSVDECFGRVLAALEKHGLAENTIVIFTSDNGGNTHSNTPDDRKAGAAAKSAFFEDWRKWAGDQAPTNNAPLRDGKGTLYEGGTRVPCMWSWGKQIAGGTTNDRVVGHVDVYPTLLELLGLPRKAEQTFDGVSYAPLLRGTGTLAERPFFLYHPHAGNGRAGGITIRRGDWKLMRWFGFPPGDPARYELYNLRDDLSEQTNLAEKDPERVKSLDAEIDRFLQETGALYPRPNPNYNATVAKQPAALGPDDGTGPLAGWKLRGPKLEKIDGGLRLTGDAKAFVGTVQYKFAGPGKLMLKLRAPQGGKGEVQWRTTDEEEFDPKNKATFDIPAGDEVKELTFDIPSQGEVRHLRVFLPLAHGAIELYSIEARGAGRGKG